MVRVKEHRGVEVGEDVAIRGPVGRPPGPVVVGGVEPIHLLVGEDVVARAQHEVVGCRAAQGVRAAELGVGPGVGEGVGGAVVGPAQ